MSYWLFLQQNLHRGYVNAALRFSDTLDWLRTVESRRFCTAPNSTRLLSTDLIIRSKLAIASCALLAVEPEISSILAQSNAAVFAAAIKSPLLLLSALTV